MNSSLVPISARVWREGGGGGGRLCGQPSAGTPTSGWDFDARSDLGIASKTKNVGSWDRPPGDPPGTPLLSLVARPPRQPSPLAAPLRGAASAAVLCPRALSTPLADSRRSLPANRHTRKWRVLPHVVRRNASLPRAAPNPLEAYVECGPVEECWTGTLCFALLHARTRSLCGRAVASEQRTDEEAHSSSPTSE